MSIPGKVLIALLSALAVSAASGLINDQLTLASLFLPTAAAALLSVVLSHRALPMPTSLAAETGAQSRDGAAGNPQHGKEQAAKSGRASGKKPRQAKQASDSKPSANGGSVEKPKVIEAAGDSETGTVKWFNASKGFGFVVRENGEEIFVHHRSIQGEGRRSLRDGAAVSFRVVTTEKGPQAEDVEPLS